MQGNRRKINKEHWYEIAWKSAEGRQKDKLTISWHRKAPTERTIPSSEPDIVIRDNEKGRCMLIDTAISEDRNVIKERSRDFKIWRPYNRNTPHVECKNKCDINNNRSKLNHLKIIQRIPEQHSRKARNQGNTETRQTMYV
jgi:hypothetical protein